MAAADGVPAARLMVDALRLSTLRCSVAGAVIKAADSVSSRDSRDFVAFRVLGPG